MLEFLKGKHQGELDGMISRLEANKSNNYKDNAQANFVELQEKYQLLLNAGKLNQKQEQYYQGVIDTYKISLQGYTHKDQTPYWK